MNWQIGSLPLHPLFVHFTATAVPTAALIAILVVPWPAARRKLGIIAPIVGLIAAISVPLASSSGEALEEQVTKTPQLEFHTDVAELMLPFMGVLFVLMAAYWLVSLHSERFASRVPAGLLRVLTIALPVAQVLAAIGTLIVVFIVGHSGATAVWTA